MWQYLGCVFRCPGELQARADNISGYENSAKIRLQRVLSKSRNMKNSSDCRHLHIAPDRDFKERWAHKELVEEMKKSIMSQPNKYYYIRDHRVISADKSPNQRYSMANCMIIFRFAFVWNSELEYNYIFDSWYLLF